MPGDQLCVGITSGGWWSLAREDCLPACLPALLPTLLPGQPSTSWVVLAPGKVKGWRAPCSKKCRIPTDQTGAWGRKMSCKVWLVRLVHRNLTCRVRRPQSCWLLNFSAAEWYTLLLKWFDHKFCFSNSHYEQFYYPPVRFQQIYYYLIDSTVGEANIYIAWEWEARWLEKLTRLFPLSCSSSQMLISCWYICRTWFLLDCLDWQVCRNFCPPPLISVAYYL